MKLEARKYLYDIQHAGGLFLEFTSDFIEDAIGLYQTMSGERLN